MKTRFLTFAVLALTICGCEPYQQKKPQTGMGVRGLSVQAPAGLPWGDDDNAQQRSFRLFGPGVSPDKQTRL